MGGSAANVSVDDGTMISLVVDEPKHGRKQAEWMAGKHWGSRLRRSGVQLKK